MAKINTVLFGELAIIPHPAETPIRESLEFFTDMLESNNGTEERLQLRSKARHKFSYDIPLQAWRTAEAFNTETGAIRKQWAVPIWTEAQYVGTIAEAAITIACDTTIYDLRAESLALLYTGCDNWQIVEIATLDAVSIVPYNELVAMRGAWLIPIRLGAIVGNVSKPTNGHSGKTSLTFEIEVSDIVALTPDVPTQYLSNDLYLEPPLLSGSSVDRSIEQRLDVTDFALGPVARRSPWLNSQFGTSYRSVIEGGAEMREYKKFLYRRAGKFKSFYMPTFENNLRVANVGTIVSTLVAKSDSFIDYASLRTNIAIKLVTGEWLIRGISNPIQIDEERIQLTLSSALNIAVEKIAFISYLGLNRFDTDRIEITWLGNNVAESNVRILEIKP